LRKAKKSLLVCLIISILIVVLFQSGGLHISPISSRIGPGSPENEVKKVQQKLKSWGYYNGEITGSYGMDTLLAVKDYQLCHGLKPTGITDSKTQYYMGLTTITVSNSAYAQGTNTSDEQLLARAINGEARGEPYEGQVAVGAVILNRTKDPRFPKTIAGVIYQPGAFTAVSDGQINVPIDEKSTVVKAARDALNGWDPTGGCVYYWNPATATSKWIWSRQIVKKIGKHYFGK